MSRPAEILAILFADITGSTALYDSLGDVVAKDVIGRCIDELIRVTGTHDGRVVKTIGDEIMCAFPDAARASLAAGDMHMAIRNAFQDGMDAVKEMHITVGFHIGPVLAEQGDVFGDTVNVAARLVKLAKPDQTTTSRETLDQLPPPLKIGARYIDETVLKGKSETIEVYELLWEVLGVTMMADVPRITPTITHSQLIIRIAGQETRYRKEILPLTLGRSEDVDLVIDNSLASRRHALLEYVKGRFVLVDQSVNGTYFTDAEGRETIIRRDRVSLGARGRISLGQAAEDLPEWVLEFECQ